MTTTKQLVVTYEPLTGLCGDGETQAAVIHVEGPDGSFDWCGGQPALEALFQFLQNLRQCDVRVAQRLTTRRLQPTE